MKAEIVYFYAYDVAGDLLTERMTDLFGRPLKPLVVEPHKRAPSGLFFTRPLTVELDLLQRQTAAGPITVRIAVRLFSVGAISIMVRTSVEFGALEDLLAYHTLRFNDRTLDEEIQALATRVGEAIKPYAIKPNARLVEPETYTVFCLSPPSDEPDVVVHWFDKERRRIAALLTQESDPARLSEQEVRESTQYHFSYYSSDLVVVDWDAGLIVDNPRAYDELLNVFELANLQQEELTEYDRLLDVAIQKLYDDLLPTGPRPVRGRGQIQRGLREIRIDLARLSDELGNTTKFFGDWHVARIYEGVAKRFHLGDWASSVNQKLRTLESMYNLLQQERNNRVMLVLETAIVALFLLDLAVLMWPLLSHGH
jgi:hypothetical protein